MMTKSRMKALEAVATGLVIRIYQGDGNVLKGPPGVGSTTLWHLDRAGLIKDGHGEGSNIYRQVQILTPAGHKAFEKIPVS